MKNLRSVHKKMSFNKDYLGDEIDLYCQLYNEFPNSYHMKLDEMPEDINDFLKENNWYNEESILESGRYNNLNGVDESSTILLQLPHQVFMIFDKSEMIIGSTGYTFLYSCEEGKKIVMEIKKFLIKKQEAARGGTYLVSSSYGNLYFEKVKLENPFNELNLDAHYNNDFKKYHDLIVQSVNGYKPGLILLHGKPGTGKTSYLKHIMHQSPRKMIYLTSEMMGSLTDPDLVKHLLQKKGSVLVVEDADEVIMDRAQSGNKSAVSTLLNITDGILSQLLNMTVICTFNTDIRKVDTALIRKGRLICRYEFKELTKTKTEAIVGKPVPEGLTLADAINYESESFEQEHKKIGFNL